MGTATSKTPPQIQFQKVKENIIQKLNTGSLGQKVEHKNLNLETYIKDIIHSRRLGCFFGCLIGDALGAYCEFQTQIIQQSTLEEAMSMPGGGVFDLHAGQFTDDTEMAFHLMKALTTFDPRLKLKDQYDKILKQIAKQYVRWMETTPFDIGITCRKGIQVLKSFNLQNSECQIDDILNKVKAINGNSQSNGSLMRIGPIAIFLSSIKQDPIHHQQFIKDQIALIHSNEILQEAGFLWVKMLYQLILRQNSEIQTFSQIYKKVKENIKNPQIKKWLFQAQNGQPMEATQNIGWAKIAWTYGMDILRKFASSYKWQNNYKNHIKEIIKRGGDSDTNAAIVGGLLGAVFGFKGLPSNYLNTVFNLSFRQVRSHHRQRPKQYQASNVLIVLLALIQNGEVYQQQNNGNIVKQPASNL